MFMEGDWYGSADRAYIKGGYVLLDALCASGGYDVAQVRRAIEEGQLPRPTYRVEGGDWVPPDYLALLEEVLGDFSRVESVFAERFQEAYQGRYGQPAPGPDVNQAWHDYLSGEYGICLWTATPEHIVQKGWLMEQIRAHVQGADPTNQEWRAAASALVDALDALERPWAAGDRLRFGTALGRDVYVAGVRALFDLP